MSLDVVADLLSCPHCNRAMVLAGRSLGCPSGHNFDLARQGYVNLLTGKPAAANADSVDMVAARHRFLDRGGYQRLADRVATLAAELTTPAEPHHPVIIDAGAGTGYYLRRMLERAAGSARGIATDLSVPALRRAARSHPRLGAVAADTWTGLPVRTGTADLITVIFAPRNPAEFARILRPGGALIVAGAGDDHLAEIREPLQLLDIQPGKLERLRAGLADRFEWQHSELLTIPMRLDADGLADLVAMGPNAHHQDDRLAERIAGLRPPVPVTAAVQLTVFRARSAAGLGGG